MKLHKALLLTVFFFWGTFLSIGQEDRAFQAATKGLRFLIHKESHAFTTIIGLRYINDKFLGSQDSVAKMIAPSVLQFAGKHKSSSFNRLLFEGNFLDTTSIHLWPTIDKATIAALYCDIVPVSDNYLMLLNAYADTGDIYLVTHTAMALQLLIENKCYSSAEPSTKDLHSKLANKMVEFLDKSTVINDPYVESVMMLYYIGARGMVKSEYIQNIITVQLPDGGWAGLKSEESFYSNDHTTVLAVWALFAFIYEGNDAVTWIQR